MTGPDEIERARISQVGRAVLDVTEAHVKSRREAIERRVYAAIKAGTLRADEALAAWYEMHALHGWVAELRQMAKGHSKAR